MEDTVITATREMRMIDIPASISVVTAKDLEEMGAKSIAEGLKKVPGIVDKSSSNDKIDIRGTQVGMSGGPVILIDGVPQKVGASRYDHFNFIPVSQVERIEVLRSPGIVYGPGTARGVINIITKKGKMKELVKFDTAVSCGSWNTLDEHISLSGGVNQWDYFLDATNFATDGYEDEEKDRLSTLLKLGYDLSDEVHIGIRGNFVTEETQSAYDLKKMKWQLDNYRQEKHFPKSETNSTLYWHNEKEQDIATIALDFSQKREKLFLKSAWSWTGLDEEYRSLKDLLVSPAKIYHDDRDQDTYTFTLSGGYDIDLGGIVYTPSLGFNFEDIDYTQLRSYPNDPAKSTDKYDLDIEERQYGFFWDNDFIFNDQWRLKLGGRMDDVDLKFANKVPTEVEHDKTLFGWALAPSYHFSGKGNVFASASRTFWFPTPQFYAWAAQYDSPENRPEDLKPEESLTYELGYKHLFHDALNVSLTGFFTAYEDKFLWYYDSLGNSSGYKNVGETEHKGIELEVDGRVCPLFGYRVSGTYLKVEWTDGQMRVYEHPSNTLVTSDLKGYDMYGIPNYSYVLGFDLYPKEGLKYSIDINTTGPYYLDALNRIEYGEKTTLDANISYKVKDWRFWLLGKNLFDIQ
ncbi:MAG: TonB-dependent receptor, partial [Candidatus Omnitrophica bacterium]|nr:TonB-dependent receptor [Candidatus Omnitrophota bacterium]